MSKNTLYDRVWDQHKVATLPSGQDQIFIGLHLVHEVTSPQAFSMLKESGQKILFPNRTFATVDHIVPTLNQVRPYEDPQAEKMAQALDDNVKEAGIPFFNTDSGKQGIVHVVGPELGLTRPGMTVVCGDSHTSTHGAFGSLAFGIGTSEVRMVLETQSLALSRLKVKRINVNGTLKPGVFAKDVILKIIQHCGIKGGIGFAYEFGGDVFDAMSMEERMTVCNMSIEGGARIGYVNPDQTTFDYIEGREYAPKAEAFDKAVEEWKTLASGPDAEYDEVITINASDIGPMITWGINPEQSVSVDENLPNLEQFSTQDIGTAEQAYDYMKFTPNSPATDININVAFVGSCTNSRISDLQEAAKVLKGNKVHKSVRMIVVPGSQQVKKEAEEQGLDQLFINAGAEWRQAGCSMCLAMNPDKLIEDEVCASSSNRNFIGRQGSPTGRTLLMSPAMVAGAAIHGHVTDIRESL